MADATGHMDYPGTGPWSSNLTLNGIPTGHYLNENQTTRRVELIKANQGSPDTLVKEFHTVGEARTWLEDEWKANRLP